MALEVRKGSLLKRGKLPIGKFLFYFQPYSWFSELNVILLNPVVSTWSNKILKLLTCFFYGTEILHLVELPWLILGRLPLRELLELASCELSAWKTASGQSSSQTSSPITSKSHL